MIFRKDLKQSGEIRMVTHFLKTYYNENVSFLKTKNNLNYSRNGLFYFTRTLTRAYLFEFSRLITMT